MAAKASISNQQPVIVKRGPGRPRKTEAAAEAVSIPKAKKSAYGKFKMAMTMAKDIVNEHDQCWARMTGELLGALLNAEN